jgi:hypothetical protein
VTVAARSVDKQHRGPANATSVSEDAAGESQASIAELYPRAQFASWAPHGRKQFHDNQLHVVVHRITRCIARRDISARERRTLNGWYVNQLGDTLF